MAKQVDARQALRGGDRRSIGRANEIAEVAKTDPGVFAQLMDGMAADDPLIVMRCADAAEKASLFDPRLLAPHKPKLLKMLASAEQPELRWHIAQMVPRLSLTSPQAKKAFSRLLDYTQDRSGIVRTCAMQALHDLALSHASLRREALQHIQQLVKVGSPAMIARGKRLVRSLQRAE